MAGWSLSVTTVTGGGECGVRLETSFEALYLLLSPPRFDPRFHRLIN